MTTRNMNLVIDIGNTFVKTYIFGDNNEILRSDRTTRCDTEQFAALLSAYYIESAVISTTRKHDDLFVGWLKERIPYLLCFDPATTPVPIGNDYATPKTLGADRLAAAVAAAEMFPGKEVMIFDFGTALTIDNVTADGVYKGGNISLGLSTRFEALHNATARLPLVAPVKEGGWPLFGNSTLTAVESGIMNSMLFEVESYIRLNPDKITIFTGGEAVFFEKSLKSVIFADYELVPKGLNSILRHNAKKNLI